MRLVDGPGERVLNKIVRESLVHSGNQNKPTSCLAIVVRTPACSLKRGLS